MSRFAYLKKFSLNYSSSLFAIRVNLLHPSPSLLLYGLLLSLWCLSILVNYVFSGFLQFKGNFVWGQSNSKYRDWAPLRHLLSRTRRTEAYPSFCSMKKCRIITIPLGPRVGCLCTAGQSAALIPHPSILPACTVLCLAHLASFRD